MNYVVEARGLNERNGIVPPLVTTVRFFQRALVSGGTLHYECSWRIETAPRLVPPIEVRRQDWLCSMTFKWVRPPSSDDFPPLIFFQQRTERANAARCLRLRKYLDGTSVVPKATPLVARVLFFPPRYGENLLGTSSEVVCNLACLGTGILAYGKSSLLYRGFCHPSRYALTPRRD